MKSISKNPVLRIHRMGELAHNILSQETCGRVLATFSNAIYLINTQDDIFWLATERIPMHQRAIHFGGPLPRVAVDSSFAVIDQHLELNSNFILDFSQASLWGSPPPFPGDNLPIDALPERLGTISSLLDNLPSPKGFGIFISEILKFIQDQPSPHSFPKLTAASEFAWPVIQEISKACIAHDFPRILESAAELIGLGEGLTPSGDDFVGGLLFCLTTLRHIYGPFHDVGVSDLAFFLERSKPRTNIISFTMLKDHAAGHASGTLHQFINAMLTGQCLESTYPLVMELIQIGHSTGWDMLAGVLTGMLITIDMGSQNTFRVPSLTSYPL
jgi:hypothetical protein